MTLDGGLKCINIEALAAAVVRLFTQTFENPPLPSSSIRHLGKSVNRWGPRENTVVITTVVEGADATRRVEHPAFSNLSVSAAMC
jgi:hypothetical protein